MPGEVGTYQSNYTGGQVDAAISAIGAAPDIYLTIAQYNDDVDKIRGAVESFSGLIKLTAASLCDFFKEKRINLLLSTNCL